jgi:hypothetical protein
VSYEAGYRDGESSRTADFLLLFHDADTMDGLLADFRRLTGDPELEWPGEALAPDEGALTALDELSWYRSYASAPDVGASVSVDVLRQVLGAAFRAVAGRDAEIERLRAKGDTGDG